MVTAIGTNRSQNMPGSRLEAQEPSENKSAFSTIVPQGEAQKFSVEQTSFMPDSKFLTAIPAGKAQRLSAEQIISTPDSKLRTKIPPGKAQRLSAEQIIRTTSDQQSGYNMSSNTMKALDSLLLRRINF